MAASKPNSKRSAFAAPAITSQTGNVGHPLAPERPKPVRMGEEPTKMFATRLPVGLIKRVKQASLDRDENIQQVVTEALEKYLAD